MEEATGLYRGEAGMASGGREQECVEPVRLRRGFGATAFAASHGYSCARLAEP